MDNERDLDISEHDPIEEKEEEVGDGVEEGINVENEVQENKNANKDDDNEFNVENELNDEDPDNQDEFLSLNTSTAVALEKERNILLKKQRKTLKNKNSNIKYSFMGHLLDQEDLPQVILEILNKEIEKIGTIDATEPEELNSFWNEMYQYIVSTTKKYMENKDTNSEDLNNQARETLDAIVDLILYSKHCILSITTNHSLFCIFAFLNRVLTTDIDLELGLKISEVCEICIISGVEVEKKVYIDVIYYLLDVILKKKNTSKNTILRLSRLTLTLKFVKIRSPYCKSLFKGLLEVPKCPVFLSTKEGRAFVSLLFGKIDVKLIKFLYNSVKEYLPSAKRSEAMAYGEILFNAWNSANTEFKEEIQVQCFQHLVEHVFILPRVNNLHSMNRLGENVFTILKYLHYSRKHTNFSRLITNIYAPFIWRYLRCGEINEKCNAVEVFMDVYPMEKIGQGVQSEIEFQEKQQNEMIDLLNERYGIIRTMAIKGVCAKLKTCWNTFSPESVQVITRTLLVDLANDGASADVRKAVFTGMAVVLENENAAKFLERILPQTKDSLHDVNEKVRISYIKMLLKLKKLKYPRFKFLNVVTIKHLLSRLKYDSSNVSQLIAELLVDYLIILDDKQRTMMNICKMIVYNGKGARKFFGSSMKVLKFDDAVKLIKLMMTALRWFVKKKEEASRNNSENISPESSEESHPKKKRRTSERNSLEVIQENQVEQKETGEEETQKKFSFENREVVFGVIQIISILWCLQTKELLAPNNKGHLNDVYDLAASIIPLLIKHYKNTHKDIYYSVIYLGSLVPLCKLSPNSTIGSACMSHIKSISEASSVEETSVVITALCAWNRCNDIVELVINSLDQAFRPEGLNQSAIPPEGYRSRSVKFHHIEEVNPIMALHILDTMLSSKINQKRVYKKSCNQMYELSECLAKLKVIAENRVTLGIPLNNPLLPDDFIVQGLYRYYKNLFYLSNHTCEQTHSQESNITVELTGIMDWARRVIFPFMPDNLSQEPGICEKILRDILKIAILIIRTDTVMVVGNESLKNTAEFMRNLLSFGCSLWFVELCLSTLLEMVIHVEVFSDKLDEAAVMKTTIPVIMSHVFLCLSKAKYSKQIISTCIKRLNLMKSELANLPYRLLCKYGVNDPIVFNVLKMYITACVSVICIEVREIQTIDTVNSIKELPVVSSIIINSLMSRKEFTNLWVLIFAKLIKGTFSEDAFMVMSCVSLLHTLSFHNAKLNRGHLSLAVKAAHEALNKYDLARLNVDNTSNDDDLSTSSISSNVNVKAMSLPILSAISDKLGLSLTATTTEHKN